MSVAARRIEGIRRAYSNADKARCAERFRHHIYSPRFPHRRIHRRYRCSFCKEECQTEFHHVDYSRPFFGSWLCTSCHRCVEAGSIVLAARHLFNYESLVRTVPSRWRSGQRGPAVGGKRSNVVPF
jgi:hypothetical protein